jgi:hypothetical protein
MGPLKPLDEQLHRGGVRLWGFLVCGGIICTVARHRKQNASLQVTCRKSPPRNVALHTDHQLWCITVGLTRNFVESPDRPVGLHYRLQRVSFSLTA